MLEGDGGGGGGAGALRGIQLVYCQDFAMAIDYIGNSAWQLTRTRGTAHRTMNNRDNSFGWTMFAGFPFGEERGGSLQGLISRRETFSNI